MFDILNMSIVNNLELLFIVNEKRFGSYKGNNGKYRR